MAKETQQQNTDTPVFVRPTGLVNVAEKFAVYDGGDARVLAIGTKAPPIHGHMLGCVKLPSVQKKNDDGEDVEWWGIVIQLLQPCPVKDANAKDEHQQPIKRMGRVGEKIILTETKAFERYSVAAEHPTRVYEACIFPMVGQNRTRTRRLWTFPELLVGKPIKRTEKHSVGLQLDDGSEDAAQLTAGTPNGATAQTSKGAELPVT
jgi:hypothetical protein